MDDAILDHGSNISGIGLLLNVEKLSNSVDIDDMEKRVKNMYIESPDDGSSADEDDQDSGVLQEYEQAMEDIQSEFADEEDEEDGEEEDEEEEDDEDSRSVISAYSRKSSSSRRGGDAFYAQKTRDERLQSSISRAMEGVPKINLDMEHEIEDERKNTLLEQIESIRDDLGELGVSVEGSAYHASYDAPLKRIEEVHRRLTFKYNKLKYNSIAEEALVAGASLLEMIFNGKHEYFGCRPDITGYSDVVKSKLKRIRVETSTAVSRFVTTNRIGVVPRLMMELLPSLITQSQRRKLQVGDSLNANVTYKKGSIRSHISDLNNMLPG